MEELIRGAFIRVEVFAQRVAEGHYNFVGPNDVRAKLGHKCAHSHFPRN